MEMLWAYKYVFKELAPILQWSFFEHEINVVNTNADKHLVLFINAPWLLTEYVYYTAGERIKIWFSRSQASFKQVYSVFDSQVQVALNSVQLIVTGPKSVLGKT